MILTTNNIGQLFYDPSSNGITQLRDVIPVAPLVDRFVFSEPTEFLNDATTTVFLLYVTKHTMLDLIPIDRENLEKCEYLSPFKFEENGRIHWRVFGDTNTIHLKKYTAASNDNPFIKKSPFFIDDISYIKPLEVYNFSNNFSNNLVKNIPEKNPIFNNLFKLNKNTKTLTPDWSKVY